MAFSSLHDQLELEMLLGNSHECLACGHRFLASSDGCPSCGHYRITPLHSSDASREDGHEGKVLYHWRYDPEKEEIVYSSPDPPSNKGEPFGSITANLATGEITITGPEPCTL